MFQIFKDSKFDFMRLRRFWVMFSFAMLILSVVAVATKGIHWGIEFEGGAQVQVKYPAAPDVATIRQVLSQAGYTEAIVTTIGKPGDNEIYVRVPLKEGAKDNDVAAQVVRTLQAGAGGQPLTVSSQSYIGPTVGRELIQKAVWAVIGAIGGMLVYIWFRFEFQWGLAAIIAMIHDAMISDTKKPYSNGEYLAERTALLAFPDARITYVRCEVAKTVGSPRPAGCQ